jgi:nucleotide-binding universal stress UspA family protein
MTKSRILVPVDGSPDALRAVRFAARRHAADGGAVLMLLNVQPRMPTSRFVRPAMIKDHHERMSEEALAPARKLCERLGAEYQSQYQQGDPAQVIASFAQRARCSEIVMGTRGLGRISGLMLGSVATKVIQLATVPVTLVK